MGEPLPEEYRRTYDPFVALTAAASATSRIRLGTGICLVAQRDPIVTAKEVASLDLYSGGRFVFGVGFGWNEDELRDHGVAMAERRDVARDNILAMQALWADDPQGYDGKHVRLSPSWAFPKPPQRPRPPILVGGGAGPKLFSHIAEYADGWIPIGGAGVRESLPALHEAMDKAGRDPATLDIAIFFAMPTKEKLDYYRELGVTEVVSALPSATADTVLPLLDRYAQLLGTAQG
jgi:probable F420-dependent oxidoreductase